jgi:cation diffusion facilitator family transporter
MSEIPRPRVDMPAARPPVPVRHSVAALRAGENRGSQRGIAVALVANVVVGAAKLVAGLMTGSAALLAEAGHSAADSVNEMLLGLSLRHARRPADPLHPLGHESARFLWAFLAAISSFLIGGCLSIALAVRELLVGAAVERYLVGWIVLAVAFCAEGISLLQSLALTRREATLWGETTMSFLRNTSEPTLRAIVVEDAAALIGLLLAAVGLLLHQFAGLARADAIAALLIGVLLAATAFGLARPLADLLIGRSMLPARLERVYAILEQSPSIDEILSVLAVYGAPQEVIVGAKVHPAPGQTADQLAVALDDIDHTLRKELPEVAEVFIDLTSFRAGSSQGQRGPAEQTEHQSPYDESNEED